MSLVVVSRCGTTNADRQGWGPWEERLFAKSSYATRLGLAANFSVREYALQHPRGPAAHDPVLKAFAEWTYLLWLRAWRDVADTSRAAAFAQVWLVDVFGCPTDLCYSSV